MTWIVVVQLLGGTLLLLGNAFLIPTEFGLIRARPFDETDRPGGSSGEMEGSTGIAPETNPASRLTAEARGREAA